MNPFSHITDSFDNHVFSKYMGGPGPGQSQLPGQLAARGGTPASAAAQVMQPRQTTSPVSQPGRTPPEMTRNIPGMQTTPAMGVLGSNQAPQPTHMGPNMLDPHQFLNGQFAQSGNSNPFLTYLSQKFGPNALFSKNQAPSAQLPIQGQAGTNVMQNVMNKNSFAMPPQRPIPTGGQIGSGGVMINLGPNSQGGIGA